MRLGVLDVGSNTVHLLVVDAHRGAAPLPAYSHKTELRLAEHLDKDGKIALATVIGTWGSAPVGIGGQLVIGADGRFEGSVSGGCVEGEVITEAEDIMASGKPKTLEFGVADETAWKVGLSCGGKIRVFVERVE